MKKAVKFFKTLNILLPLLGIASIVIGFSSLSNDNAIMFVPCLIFGIVLSFVGVICGVIKKILNFRINGGLAGSVASIVGKIKDSIDNSRDNSEDEISDEMMPSNTNKQVTCAYCGMTYNKDAGACPGCGAHN